MRGKHLEHEDKLIFSEDFRLSWNAPRRQGTVAKLRVSVKAGTIADAVGQCAHPIYSGIDGRNISTLQSRRLHNNGSWRTD